MLAVVNDIKKVWYDKKKNIHLLSNSVIHINKILPGKMELRKSCINTIIEQRTQKNVDRYSYENKLGVNNKLNQLTWQLNMLGGVAKDLDKSAKKQM